MLASLVLCVSSAASFRWVTAVITGAGDGSGGDTVSEWHGLGLQWYQHMQVQPNYYTGGSQVVYSYIAVDSKLATVNDVSRLSGAATADPGVTHTSAGLIIAAAVLDAVAALALLGLQRGVPQYRWRRVLFLGAPLLSAVAAVLCVGAVTHWASSNIKEVACDFFAGPGALVPNQHAACGFGASFHAGIAAVPLLLLQAACFAVWLQGDTAALLCGGAVPAAGSSARGGGSAVPHTPPPHEASGLLRNAGGR